MSRREELGLIWRLVFSCLAHKEMRSGCLSNVRLFAYTLSPRMYSRQIQIKD